MTTSDLVHYNVWWQCIILLHLRFISIPHSSASHPFMRHCNHLIDLCVALWSYASPEISISLPYRSDSVIMILTNEHMLVFYSASTHLKNHINVQVSCYKFNYHMHVAFLSIGEDCIVIMKKWLLFDAHHVKKRNQINWYWYAMLALKQFL